MIKRLIFFTILLISLAGNGLALMEGCEIYKPIRIAFSAWFNTSPQALLSKNEQANLIKEDTSPPQKQPFKIAFNTWLGYSPLVWANELGFLKQEGLSVEITFLEGIAEKNSALIRGEIDGVGHTADSAVTSAAVGVDGQIVYVFDKSFGADGILANSNIKSVKDLKGKQVAVETGFTGHFFLLSILDEVGLKESDIDIVAMDTGSAGSAFMANKIDAAVTWEPWIGKSKKRKDAHILMTSADRPGLIIDVLYMRRETIENRKKDIAALIRAMSKATDWYLHNKDKGDQIMAKFWKLSLKDTQETAQGIRFMTLDENKIFFGSSAQPGLLLNTVKNANNLWFRAGIIKKQIEQPNNLIYYSESLDK